MALTRKFRETVLARVQKDSRFRDRLLCEALNAFIAGDTTIGKALLRDLINATVGFEELAFIVGIPSKSLHRMLAPRGNPTTESFFAIIHALQDRTHVRLRVVAKSA